jgi:hypothetical protein
MFKFIENLFYEGPLDDAEIPQLWSLFINRITIIHSHYFDCLDIFTALEMKRCVRILQEDDKNFDKGDQCSTITELDWFKKICQMNEKYIKKAKFSAVKFVGSQMEIDTENEIYACRLYVREKYLL